MPLTSEKGFSLLEIALALLLVGILIQSVTSILSESQQRQTHKQTEQELQSIKKALLSYLQVNHYLPCPDTGDDGRENRGDEGQCSAHQGAFPYLEFGGVGRQDEFGNRFFYAINSNSTSTTEANDFRLSKYSASVFAKNSTIENDFFKCDIHSDDTKPVIRYASASQCSQFCNSTCISETLVRTKPPYFNQLTGPLGTTKGNGTLRICFAQSGECNNDTNFSELSASAIPLTIVSFGQNGAQTWQDCNQASNHEQENCDGDRYFQQHPISQDFDDQLIWITMHEVKALLSQHIFWHHEAKEPY